jgi:NAD(P)-dependent dehydrogenase (short-subunit alcohol dehydrogenase family)
LKVAIADVTADKLQEVGGELAKIAGEANVLVVPTDVSKIEEVVRLRDRVYEAWGEVRSSLAAAPAQSLSPALHLRYS